MPEFTESTAVILIFGLIVNALALWLAFRQKPSIDKDESSRHGHKNAHAAHS
jgi:hypothetical protein